MSYPLDSTARAQLSAQVSQAYTAFTEGREPTREQIEAVEETLQALNTGSLRVVEADKDSLTGWKALSWAKQAILCLFRMQEMQVTKAGALSFWDKVPLKYQDWSQENFQKSGVRVVPGAIVRSPASIGSGTVLMPSFVNVGAYIGRNSMVDTWATVGSCAQIGNNVHLSGGVGVGGVLEPLQAAPVVIEDNCFIGARSEIVEGAVVKTGSVLAMGVFIGASTKIVDRQSGEIFKGYVPEYSVVVPGTYGSFEVNGTQGALSAAVIVKRVDEQTRSKTSINELLHDY